MAAMFDPKRRRRKPWNDRAYPFFHLDGASCAFVSDADVLDALADDGDCFAREASLSTEDAAGTALAC
ncbi:hypothetical protein WMF27_42165 [Sorangium sp. So ce281]|uniref:hypothetical protein n=1 Tax=unclassified Sorangium TaxID=2621164 RepID=UPI003F62B8ED